MMTTAESAPSEIARKVRKMNFEAVIGSLITFAVSANSAKRATFILRENDRMLCDQALVRVCGRKIFLIFLFSCRFFVLFLVRFQAVFALGFAGCFRL